MVMVYDIVFFSLVCSYYVAYIALNFRKVSPFFRTG